MQTPSAALKINYLATVQHVEFFHTHHFEERYHRKKAKKSLADFIEFFWETDFEEMWKQYPQGFSDTLFPNVGYTYLINLGTPFVMDLEGQKKEVRSDAFLPRYKNMTCHHTTGNKIFGIKFKISPVVFEKPVNFSEYREYIFPLAYLIDPGVVQKIKEAGNFAKRVELISTYYDRILEKHAGTLPPVAIVSAILKSCWQGNNFSVSVEELARQYGISSRTLQRYFETTTSITSKQALQIMRIRKAVEQLQSSPRQFHYRQFGYYDYSHFYKHLKGFLHEHAINIHQPHLQFLKPG